VILTSFVNHQVKAGLLKPYAANATEKLKPAYIAREDSSYEQQSNQPPRTYPGKNKSISFAKELRESVTG
jgi:hypothetical protein